jgi:hypothetical protein
MAWHSRVLGLVASIGPNLILAGCVSAQTTLPGAPGTSSAPLTQPRMQKSEERLADAGNEMTLRSPAGSPHNELAVRIRAKVNGVAILDEELKNATYGALMELRNQPEPQRSALEKQVLEKALENLIEREIILAEVFAKLGGNKGGEKVLEKLRATADKEFSKQVRTMKKQAHCATDEQFKQFLLTQGQNLDAMKRQFERTLMATEYMRYLVLERAQKYGLADEWEYYRQHPNEFQTVDAVQWQDIFISAVQHGGLDEARRVALGLMVRGRAGADFAQLAEMDEGDSKFRNGEGYGKRRGEIKPAEAEASLFQMRPGDIRLVELATGVHVIKLVKRDYAGLMPFDEKTQKFILNKLKNEAAEREWRKIIKDLRAKVVIERDLSP